MDLGPQPEHDFWLSSERMTCIVTVRDGVVKRTPPILWRFAGQWFSDLIAWMRRQPGFRYERL